MRFSLRRAALFLALLLVANVVVPMHALAAEKQIPPAPIERPPAPIRATHAAEPEPATREPRDPPVESALVPLGNDTPIQPPLAENDASPPDPQNLPVPAPVLNPTKPAPEPHEVPAPNPEHARQAARPEGVIRPAPLNKSISDLPVPAPEAAATATVQDDCGSGKDAPSPDSLALTITTPVDCWGWGANGPDTWDWYRFRLGLNQETSIVLSSAEADFDFCLYSYTGTTPGEPLEGRWCYSHKFGEDEALVFVSDFGGDWYLEVIAFAGAGYYHLSITTHTIQDDCRTGADAGGHHASASTITVPEASCQGAFPSDVAADVEDWYKYAGTNGHQATVTMTPSGGDFNLCLYRPGGGPPAQCSTFASGAESILFKMDSTGDWRVRVYINSGHGTYVLSVKTNPPQDDCGTGTDAGNSFANAVAVSLPASCNGALDVPAGDSEDWYKVSGSSGGSLTVRMVPPSGSDFDLCLYAPTNGEIRCSHFSGSIAEDFTVTLFASGDHRLRVYSVSGSGTYSLSASYAPPPAQSDCGTGGDAGGSFSHAASVSPPIDCQGEIPSGDSEDWYRFRVLVGQTVSSSMTPPLGTDFDLCFYDPSGNLHGCSSNTGSARESKTEVADQTGDWRIRVSRWSGGGAYALTITLSVVHNDCSSGTDAGNDFWSPFALTSLPRSCSASFPQATGDSEDWYSFNVNAGETISASMTPASNADFDVCLYDPGGAKATCSTRAGNGAWESIQRAISTGGSWRLRVYVVSGVGTSYTFSIKAFIPQNDCGSMWDAGDSPSSATSIIAPVSCSGSFPEGTPESEDWYGLSVAQGQGIHVTMIPEAGLDFDLCLHSPDGSVTQCSRTRGGAAEGVSPTASSTGTWYLRVYAISGRGAYSLTVNLFAPQNDCGTGMDAGGTSDYATSIATPAACSGAFPGTGFDINDWYKFPISSGAGIAATLTPQPGADYDLCLHKPNGDEVQCSRFQRDAAESVSATALSGGEWRVRVQVRSSSGDGTYTLTVSTTSPQNDCLSGADAGGSSSQAARITPPVTECPGTIAASSGDEEDWYRFTVPAGTEVHTALQPTTGNLDLCLYRPDGSQAACSTLDGVSKETASGKPTAAAGDWRVRVYLLSGSGDYTLSISLVGPENDCGTGGDAGPYPYYAAPLSTPAQCAGEFRGPDTEDWYSLMGDAGTALNVVMTPNADSDFNICLYYEWQELACSTLAASATDAFSYALAQDGTYYVRVFVYEGTGSYALTVSSETAQDDCGTGSDAGNTHSQATALLTQVSGCRGTLLASKGDREDWYRVTLQAGGALEISVAPDAEQDVDLCVYTPQGGEAGCSATAGGDAERISIVAGVSGDWRVRVYYWWEDSTYTMNVNAASPQMDCGAVGDAGNTRMEARYVGLPLSCRASFPSDWADQEDWYAFNVSAGSVINGIVTADAGTDLDLCVYGQGDSSRCGTHTGGVSDAASYPAPYSGTYWARVYVVTYGAGGGYDFALKLVPPQDDCSAGGDASADFWAAAPIAPPVTCQGDARVEEGDLEDWYQFSTYEGQSVTVTLSPYDAAADLDVCLYRPTDRQTPAKCSSFTNVNTESLSYTIGQAGDWRLRIYRYSGSGLYDLSVSLAGTAPNDCGTWSEAGNTFAAATPMVAPFTCSGEFRPSSGDTEDWYRLGVQQGNALTVTLQPQAGADFDLCLYRAGGTEHSCSANVGSLQDRVSVTVDASGWWRVRVVTSTGYGSYTLSAEAPMPAGSEYATFEFDDEEGWTTTGLWHAVYEGVTPYARSYSSPAAFWFGRGDTGTYEDSLAATSGSLTSPPISLLGVPNPMLAFASWYETEDTSGTWDTKRVLISIDGGTAWTPLDTIEGDADYRRWAIRYLDISAYGGRVIMLRFQFDTSDAFYNAYGGWYVDDVRLFRDDDHDGLSAEEEQAVGSDPADSDTDDDGVLDVDDWRPTVEDIAPFFPYPPGTTVGEVKFRTADGFVDVDLKPPADNSGGGVESVDFALRLKGVAGGASVQSTLRLDLVREPTTGHWQGRFPLPRNFAGGQATSEELVITLNDINGNRAGYSGSAQEVISFRISWDQQSDPEFKTLRKADIEEDTTGVQSFQTSTYSVNPVKRGQQPATVHFMGVVGPGGSGHVGEFEVVSARVGQPPAPVVGAAENVLAFVGTTFEPRAAALGFAGGAFNTVWEGVKWGWENVVEPEVQSFVFGSDVNGRVAGDFIAGIIGFGDVRDIVIGAYTGDNTKMLMGAVGLALTFTVVGDVAYSGAKAAMKALPPSAGRALAKGSEVAVRLADDLDRALSRITLVGKHVGTDAGKASRITRFSNHYGGDDPGVLKLSRDLDARAVDKAYEKYDDATLARFKQPGSRIQNPVDFVRAAVAEAKLGGDLVKDASDLSGSEGIEKVLKLLESASPESAKGHRYVIQKGAAVKRQATTQEVAFEKDFSITNFKDFRGVLHKNKPYPPDLVVKTKEGKTFVYELKDTNVLKPDARTSNQILKLQRLLQDGKADGIGLIVKNPDGVTDELKAYARDRGVPILDDFGQVLN